MNVLGNTKNEQDSTHLILYFNKFWLLLVSMYVLIILLTFHIQATYLWCLEIQEKILFYVVMLDHKRPQIRIPQNSVR